jgi:spore coat polysaccharide biosynthesis protein SpsF
MWKHPELFRMANVENDIDLSALRWTVDEPQDLEFVRRVYSHLGAVPSFGLAEVLVLLREYPELAAVNVGIERNEGYQKSLREDALVTPLEVK